MGRLKSSCLAVLCVHTLQVGLTAGCDFTVNCSSFPVASVLPSFPRFKIKNAVRTSSDHEVSGNDILRYETRKIDVKKKKGLILFAAAAYAFTFATKQWGKELSQPTTEFMPKTVAIEEEHYSVLPIPKAKFSQPKFLSKFRIPTKLSKHLSLMTPRKVAKRKAMKFLTDPYTSSSSTSKTEGSNRSENNSAFRGLKFWLKATVIYVSYKKTQLYCTLALPLVDPDKKDTLRQAKWEAVHALNSDRLLNLCLELRGFYLKSGQFLGTRHDFMPPIFIEKLGRLHDAVPPMSPKKVEEVLMKELGSDWRDLFTSFDVDTPLGSASISQVHKGQLAETGEMVAVKIQYPKAEKAMKADLRNLTLLASFLQKFELKFDLLSSLKELSRQIRHEFDFEFESNVMKRMGPSIANHIKEGELISVPRSILSTKRVLVMSFIEGQSLASIKRGEKERFRTLRKKIGSKLLATLADAWGYMIFVEGLFNADFHPGNILIMPEGKSWGFGGLLLGLLGVKTPKLRIGLLDWGQVKELDMDSRIRFAKLICALSQDFNRSDVISAFNGLGIVLENPCDEDSIEKLARVMFDTKPVDGFDFSPFSKSYVLNLNPVKHFPQDYYFLLRASLMFSLADLWAPHAQKILEKNGKSWEE